MRTSLAGIVVIAIIIIINNSNNNHNNIKQQCTMFVAIISGTSDRYSVRGIRCRD